jgi:hypothetical protein
MVITALHELLLRSPNCRAFRDVLVRLVPCMTPLLPKEKRHDALLLLQACVVCCAALTVALHQPGHSPWRPVPYTFQWGVAHCGSIAMATI